MNRMTDRCKKQYITAMSLPGENDMKKKSTTKSETWVTANVTVRPRTAPVVQSFVHSTECGTFSWSNAVDSVQVIVAL